MKTILTNSVIVILLLIVTAAIAYWNFNRSTQTEAARILQTSQHTQSEIVTLSMIQHLPLSVQKWQINSGVIGKELTRTVHLKQQGYMRTSLDGKWMHTKAEQWFNVSKPAFVWAAKVNMNSMLFFTGCDKFENGKGDMRIKILALIPVVHGTGKETDQGTMLRYLGEICWFPSAALSAYLHWEPINDYSAKATMTYNGMSVSAVFEFDADYNLKGISAKRYKGSGDEAALEDWYIPCTEWKVLNGVKIPVKGDAIWKLKEGDLNYYKWEITSIEYN
ncbi:MAG: hypothetical protein JST82_09890 [Bacteroidetes bacterium]|nr:hypothetical protein [Bacteroidota bacterium]